MGKGHKSSFSIKNRKYLSFVGILAFFCLMAAYLIYGFTPTPVDAQTINRLTISDINLTTAVKNISRSGNELETPDRIAGAYYASSNKVLIIGHSSTVFENLHNVKNGDKITFDNKNYRVYKTEIIPKNEIDMDEITKNENIPTIILMTCYGTKTGENDYSHRYIVYAIMEK